MSELKLPEEWAKEDGIQVYDPGGWRFDPELGPKSWDEPITREEFDHRVLVSTIRVVHSGVLDLDV